MRRGVLALAAAATLGVAAGSEGTEPKVTAANPLADSADQVMFGISTIISNNGVLRAQLVADTGYFFDGNTRIVVRNEKTTFYDATGKEDAVLTSREGMYVVPRGQMEARRNVVVVTTDGKRLETEELKYDQGSNKVTGDSAFVLTEPGRVLRGIGFVSDPNLANLQVKQVLTGGGPITLPKANP
jgi:LPS export ABC transporter protein LptC